MVVFCLLFEADWIVTALFLLESDLRIVFYHNFTLVLYLRVTFRSQIRLRELFSAHLFTSFLLIRL